MPTPSTITTRSPGPTASSAASSAGRPRAPHHRGHQEPVRVDEEPAIPNTDSLPAWVAGQPQRGQDHTERFRLRRGERLRKPLSEATCADFSWRVVRANVRPNSLRSPYPRKSGTLIISQDTVTRR